MENTSMREALEAARDLLLPQCNGGTAFAKACGETVNKIMDALKEERTSDGNMAAMREALEDVLEKIDRWRTDGVMEHWQYSQLFDIADSALAAPPRNCDRFGGDFKMLHTAWFDWTGSPSGQNPDGTVKLTFAEWLLEIAEVHHA